MSQVVQWTMRSATITRSIAAITVNVLEFSKNHHERDLLATRLVMHEEFAYAWPSYLRIVLCAQWLNELGFQMAQAIQWTVRSANDPIAIT